MSRLSSNILVLLAAGCGVMTAYATFQPEFEKQAAERRGDFSHQHASNTEDSERALSKAIASDFREAGEQFRDTRRGGFAWGLRQMLAGKPDASAPNQSSTSRHQEADGNK
ncbi:hypothetical protein K431DRAFT_301120 [Polychaeton citri CBS 116435]|uniref:Uncharacterized protein n=1 Tax=Polychaeton citri CBS 116435 TaxID=1314669 RepID=A0A9P4UQ02_9PEZI|nr:hypothetical protein K431DRAFT_301120 [Polychaeton citri CBS 116435]